MVRGNRRAANQANGNKIVTQSELKSQRRDMDGGKVLPPIIPSTFNQLPWNSWTFERASAVQAPGSFEVITIQDIISQIVTRIGLRDEDPIAEVRIKVSQAAAYLTADGLVYPDMVTEFYELAGQDAGDVQYPRETQRDKGTLNIPARAGYKFSSADRRQIFGTSKGTTKIMRVTSTPGEGAMLTTRVMVLWQASPTGVSYAS